MDKTRHILDRTIMEAVGNGSALSVILVRLGLEPTDRRDLGIRLAHMAHGGQVVKVEGFWWRT